MSTHKYRSVWEHDDDLKGWIAPSPDGNARKAFCKLCKSSYMAHKKDLLIHAKSKKHLESVKRYNAGPSRKITEFVKKAISVERKIAELKIAAFIAEHCSTRTANHLSDLINTLDKNSEILCGVKIHRTKCTALILNVISPCLLEDLISDVAGTKYSLIVDESTAVDCAKMLCVMIKYFSNSKKSIVTTFYRLMEIDSGNANTLTETLTEQLKKDNLPIENLIGVGVEGANVMIGQNHSFSTIMKSMTSQDLVIVKCVCHSLHLAAEYAFKLLPKHLDFIVKECHNWFSCSSKRQIEYKNLYVAMGEKAGAKIDKLSGTRWLARSNAVSKILGQWDVLKLHFSLAREKERCYIAQQLYEMLSDKRNYLYLVFLNGILKDVINVNKAFQSTTANSLKLMEDLLHLLRNCLAIIVPPMHLAKITDSELISFNFKEYSMSEEFIHFGYSFNEASIGVEHKDLIELKKRCKDFVLELCKQIQNRLPSNIEELQKINIVSPENATAQVRQPDIALLARSFKSICENVDDTVNEWKGLHRVEWKNKEEPVSYWAEVAESKNALGEALFGHISKLALALLSLPFSNATVERAFSVVNIIKDKLRNRLAISSTDCIMRSRFHLMDIGCANFTPTERMLNKFHSGMYNMSSENENVLDIFSNSDD